MLLLTLGAFCFAQDYHWPLTNVFDQTCNSTFGEYRSGNPNHFHEGIDIYPADNSNDVICTWGSYGAGYEVEEISGPHTDGYYVTIQHYNFTVNGSETTWIEQAHGSRYLHMTADPMLHLSVNHRYSDDVPIIENSTFYNDHLHFEIRAPAPVSSDYQDALNPMNVDANLCPDDANAPSLLALYADGSTDQSNHHQGDAVINLWNFLKYDFVTNLYDSLAVYPFIRLTLPTETRDNDLDDPHILISGNCKVRFVVKIRDVINVSGSTCAPYWIGLYIDTALAPGSDIDPIITGSVPEYEVKFDRLLETNDEKHDEEDIYHIDPPLISNHSSGEYYFRLYPYDRNGDGDIPSCILTGSRTLQTENLWEGYHRIRIVVKDIYGNVKTGDAHFYVRRSDWVDYCRAFRN